MQETNAETELVRETLVELGATLRTLGYNCPISMDASGTIRIHFTFQRIPDTKALRELEGAIAQVIQGKTIRVSITGEGPKGYTYEDNL